MPGPVLEGRGRFLLGERGQNAVMGDTPKREQNAQVRHFLNRVFEKLAAGRNLG